MEPNGQNGDAEDGPLASETHVRVLDVLDRRPIGREIHALSEPSLHLVRARLNSDSNCEAGDHLDMESGNIGPLSQLRFRDLSGNANESLQDAVKQSILVNPDPHLGFFNRVQNISLKVHGFQLLPGVGSSTARSWVTIRGQNGWVDLAEVSEKLGVEVVDLLAERYVGELAEPAEVPSLLDLLVRVSA